MLESLGSARIEGNHTTLADYVESRLEAQPAKLSDQLREMANIEEAMSLIEEQFEPGQEVTEHLVRELHAMTVQGWNARGTPRPALTDRSRSRFRNRSICRPRRWRCRSTWANWSSSSTGRTRRSTTSSRWPWHTTALRGFTPSAMAMAGWCDC